MSDICMCRAVNCPISTNCYRYRAVPNPYRQSYFGRTPYDHEKKECNRFWCLDDQGTRKLPIKKR